mmetsp:Transcript_46837/g.93364  ORF Transcript_46837/g.93364 Transcript_46837/m.93364 type:complete len:217 (-) Transcript_46837:276-926(-)
MRRVRQCHRTCCRALLHASGASFLARSTLRCARLTAPHAPLALSLSLRASSSRSRRSPIATASPCCPSMMTRLLVCHALGVGRQRSKCRSAFSVAACVCSPRPRLRQLWARLRSAFSWCATLAASTVAPSNRFRSCRRASLSPSTTSPSPPVPQLFVSNTDRTARYVAVRSRPRKSRSSPTRRSSCTPRRSILRRTTSCRCTSPICETRWPSMCST